MQTPIHILLEFHGFFVFKNLASVTVFNTNAAPNVHFNSIKPLVLLCVQGWPVSKISDCQPEGPGFNLRPGRGLNFGRSSFATPSVDRGVKPSV